MVRQILWCVITLVLYEWTFANEVRILRSPDMRSEEFLQELQILRGDSVHRINMLELKHQRLFDEADGIRRQLGRGYRSSAELEKVELALEATRSLLGARRNYHDVLVLVCSSIGRDQIVEPSGQARADDDATMRLRIPGLTLRQGESDFFTVKMKAKAGVTDALAQYTLVRAMAGLTYPNKAPLKEYADDRLEGFSEVRSVKRSELLKWQHHVAMLKETQSLINNQYRKRWSQLRQIWSFNHFVRGRKKPGEKITEYSGSQDGFWLFGDGNSRAVGFSEISPADLDIAETRAFSRYREMQEQVSHQQIRFRDGRINRLAGRGMASKGEVRISKLAGDLAEVDREITRTLTELGEKELAQLKVALTEPTEKSRIQLPDIEPGEQFASRWFDWLVGHPGIDTRGVLRVLPLIEARLLADAGIDIAGKQRQYAEDQLRKYRKIKSITPIELEQCQQALAIAEADLVKTREDRRVAEARMQQWVRQQTAPLNSNGKIRPDKMAAVMLAGKECNLTRVKLADLQKQRVELVHNYNSDYYQRLDRVYQNGAATGFELKRAANRVKRSEGMVKSADRNLEIARQKAVVLEVLYRHGGLNFSDAGLEMTHFTPELTEALRQLTEIEDSVDPGLMQGFEADLDDVETRIRNLGTLIDRGHASPVELKWARRDKKLIENRIAGEKARAQAKDFGLAVIDALETDEDRRQKIPENQSDKL